MYAYGICSRWHDSTMSRTGRHRRTRGARGHGGVPVRLRARRRCATRPRARGERSGKASWRRLVDRVVREDGKLFAHHLRLLGRGGAGLAGKMVCGSGATVNRNVASSEGIRPALPARGAEEAAQRARLPRPRQPGSPFAPLGDHRLVADHDAIAAGRLCAVERLVGALDDPRGRQVSQSARGDADRQGHRLGDGDAGEP